MAYTRQEEFSIPVLPFLPFSPIYHNPNNPGQLIDFNSFTTGRVVKPRPCSPGPRKALFRRRRYQRDIAYRREGDRKYPNIWPGHAEALGFKRQFQSSMTPAPQPSLKSCALMPVGLDIHEAYFDGHMSKATISSGYSITRRQGKACSR
ncbi:uncharacterized protein DSM5745_08084 [Aspergillus mulundensis]|uniref:Uncharacterized protein n=1 Tax=Aspergillus mulundensis TaxID=1810919 RepID=A0A3D8R940_9EURO|nr:hypothetical protein DSM5745_08084 [Aspergillus mulundensis]RDW70573.1 hypothetical protein DSM5745_08084 [Aspergillus mulundensis]